MILLDTNVVSEASRPGGNAKLIAWLDSQSTETLHLSTITVAELRFGIAILPDGHRKRALDDKLHNLVLPLFEGRILPFDMAATGTYAAIRARARATGQAIATADGFIAAIALARGLAVATRDTSPFEAAGVPVINPWLA